MTSWSQVVALFQRCLHNPMMRLLYSILPKTLFLLKLLSFTSANLKSTKRLVAWGCNKRDNLLRDGICFGQEVRVPALEAHGLKLELDINVLLLEQKYEQVSKLNLGKITKAIINTSYHKYFQKKQSFQRESNFWPLDLGAKNLPLSFIRCLFVSTRFFYP